MKDKKKNNIFWQQWLKKYKSFKCLWDTSLEIATNERFRAWKELIEMARTVNSKANSAYIRKRLHKFIYKYKLESKKIEVAQTNGIPYEPATFCYKIFKSIDAERQKDKTNAILLKNEHRDFEKKLWTKVIKKYVSLKCLWQKGYTNQQSIKNEAWIELLKIVKPFYADADIAFLKKNITNMRASYKREEKKNAIAKANGLQHKRNLFYFDLLSPIFQKDYSLTASDCTESSSAGYDDDVCEKKIVSKNCREFVLSEISNEQNLWCEVIKRYVSLKCLWNRKQYSQRERPKAWKKLLKMVKSFQPTANLKFVKSRFNNFRSVHLREQRKIEKAKKQGIEYTTQLYYFDLLAPIYKELHKSCSDKETTDSETDSSEHYVESVKEENPKNGALRKDLESLGYICAQFEYDRLSNEKKFWLKAIKKYVSFKCLWDNENGQNYNDQVRTAAWYEVVNIIRTKYPKADLAFVKKRIHGFRTTYGRVYRKTKNLIKNGIKPYISLYYFNALSPIYQKGFPELDEENEDVKLKFFAQPQCEQILNPKFATYFPDDDELNLETESKQNITDDIKDDYKSLDYDEQTSFEQTDTYDILLDNSDEEHIQDELCSEKQELQTFVLKEYPLQLETQTYDNLLHNHDEENIQDGFRCEMQDIQVSVPEENPLRLATKTYDNLLHNHDGEHIQDGFRCEMQDLLASVSEENPLQIQTKTNKKLRQKRKLCKNYDNDAEEESNDDESNCKISKYGQFHTFETKIAQHLSTMKNEQYLLAEKLITDVCVYGRLKKLSIESSVRVKKV